MQKLRFGEVGPLEHEMLQPELGGIWTSERVVQQDTHSCIQGSPASDFPCPTGRRSSFSQPGTRSLSPSVLNLPLFLLVHPLETPAHLLSCLLLYSVSKGTRIF
jgi:hypothetical protein